MSSKKPCPFRNQIRSMTQRQIQRVANAMRIDGHTIRSGREPLAVRVFLFRMVNTHGRNWNREANAFIESMEAIRPDRSEAA